MALIDLKEMVIFPVTDAKLRGWRFSSAPGLSTVRYPAAFLLSQSTFDLIDTRLRPLLRLQDLRWGLLHSGRNR